MAELKFDIAPAAEWGILSCTRCDLRKVVRRDQAGVLAEGHPMQCPGRKPVRKPSANPAISAGLWTVSQVAKFMGVNRSTIPSWVAKGYIPADAVVKIGYYRYYRETKILELGIMRPPQRRRPPTGGYVQGSKRRVPSGIWSVTQVAAFMGVGPQTIWRWTKQGVFPTSAIVVFHGDNYYRASAIRDLGVILSPSKVAEHYGVGRATVNRWRIAGILHGIGTPGTFLYLEKELPSDKRKD